MSTSEIHNLRFPDNFLFGASTAAMQVEGAWNLEGKGENIWEKIIHENPECVADGSNSDIACDSYHLYKEDVRLLKELKVNFYRFSISWSRILPQGTIDKVNEAGIQYYNNLIDELLANKIEPVVTIFHWDLPQTLQEIGGWCNPYLIEFFKDYSDILFSRFGDRVKWWITLNEPGHVSRAYVNKGLLAPSYELRHLGADYLSIQTLLKAHAEVYHLYREKYWKSQRGKIGITLHTFWYEPLTQSKEDKEAAESALQFDLGIFAHPIYSENGDYPPVVLKTVEEKNKYKRMAIKFLPTLGKYWSSRLKGTADFLGLNHYTTRWATPGEPDWWLPDLDVTLKIDDSFLAAESSWLKTVPWGLRKLLQWIKSNYNNPPVFITENGFSDKGELHDPKRIKYITSYLREVLKAIHMDNCDVIGYAAWSLLDNFEWFQGYKEKFGLYHVDFNDPKRTRTAKTSVQVLQQIIRTRSVPLDKDLPLQRVHVQE